jgi:CelD/BcsL family acetyltransferase involved in cellulose biosynthesis/dTDP-4-amino-4,6-dideoxygalactose transaminase
MVRALSAWPPLPPGVWLRSPARHLPFPLEDPRAQRFRKGRVALWHGVQMLGLTEGDQVLVPAYHHGSEVQALLAARLVPRFYSTRPGLRPDLNELDALLNGRTRALLLIHVLGLAQTTLPYRRWCKERGLLLLEDAAQGWLAETDGVPAGWHADLALFCLYKTFGLPDGAVVFVPKANRSKAPRQDSESGLRAAAVANAAWLAQRWSVAGAGWSSLNTRRRKSFDPEAEIAIGDRNAQMSTIGQMLLPRLATVPASAIRRAHYRLLLERLEELVPTEFPPIPDGAAPFAFPVFAHDKADLLERLRRAGIHALDFWSFPHPTLEPDADRVSARLRRHVVGLPVHQELAVDDLRRVAAAVIGDRRPRERELTVTELAGFDAPEWSSLAERAGNIFGTPEWLGTWWRHLGRGELVLRQCRAANRGLVGVLPMVREQRGALSLLRLCSAEVGEELGPICAPRDETAVARAWRHMLDSFSDDWDLMLAERLPGRVSWPTLADIGLLRREASPELALAGLDWEGFLATRSRHFRKHLRYFERRLARDHGLRFRLADDPDRLDADVDTMIALHRARWQTHGIDAFAQRREDFHREFARIALDRGWLRLWFAELNGTPAAAWYGMRFAGIEWYYNAGRNPAFDELSVGHVLVAHTVREAILDGQRQYRLLRGDHEYKRRWATHDPGVETAVRAEGPRGKAALVGLHMAIALPPTVRARVRAATTPMRSGSRGSRAYPKPFTWRRSAR